MTTHVHPAEQAVRIQSGGIELEGDLVLPPDARAIVLFAHGSGSSRLSARNRYVARRLNEADLGTLLFDLLTREEEEADRRTGQHRFDIDLLARRLMGAVRWMAEHPEGGHLPVGVFGASTGAAAALQAAAALPDLIRAVVSRGGRPDLAREALGRVRAPTLLLVGGEDVPVIGLNREAMQRIAAPAQLEIVPGASHLFEEPGKLDEVARLAVSWFSDHLAGRRKAVPGQRATAGAASAGLRSRPEDVSALIREAAEPFDDLEQAGLDALLDRIGEARVVLLGEASHGTSEFYRMRARITQALIQRKGFTLVGVEADWPDAGRVNAYVQHRMNSAARAWQAFVRFPTWMWRNHEMLDFVDWLRAHNETLSDADERVGFYGLDLYSLYTSVHEVIDYLKRVDPELAELARYRYGCLTPFSSDPARYGRAVLSRGYRGCEDEVTEMLTDLLSKQPAPEQADEPLFDAIRNARVAVNAERYYRVMYYGGAEAWNLRDRHMFETLQALLAHRGPGARMIVWAHNSHLGDASATEMYDRGEINLGYLVRQAFGEQAYLIGFGTHTGTVAAASNWDEPVRVMRVQPSHPESYERLCHGTGLPRFLLPLRDAMHPALRPALEAPARLERAIGVIYRPQTERQSHYFRAVLPDQFDEYVWFDASEALRPLGRPHAPALPEHHPFFLVD